MFSYIFMKILEKWPERYNLGINILTCGHARKVKTEILRTYVKPNIKLLDIGCGTGQFAANAARAGADVVGIDISERMLSAARKRVRDQGLSAKVNLYHAGVIEMDSLFDDNSFDLITATLIISELYTEQRHWMLSEIRRILKPSGTLILADEVKPNKLLQKLAYLLVRSVLAVITYAFTGTGTKPVADISKELSETGFEITREKHSLLGSFMVVSARKKTGSFSRLEQSVQAKYPHQDFSLLKSVWDYVGRWFPNPVEPGLRIIGSPTENSPVLVTSNFHLTVRRLEKALRDSNCYVLAAPTRGINVWCAACGGTMNSNSIITVIKTSGINEKVHHRRLILPQLCAPGIDRKLLRQETGWDSSFGPVYATDVPSFLSNNCKKTLTQTIARFPLSFRLEMLFSMNFLIFGLIGFIAFLINPGWLLYLTVFFWVPGIILYAGFPFFPGKSGWAKAITLAGLEVLCIALLSVFILGQPYWAHWGWMIAASAMTIWLGFDLRGSVGANPSEAEYLVTRLGIKSIGKVFTSRGEKSGVVQKDESKCTNCQMCIGVCPSGVFSLSKNGGVLMNNPSKCFTCNACIKQCPADAFHIACWD